ncbi:MAG: DUF5615 family PIN-like protein [Candidatus Coatesbacteria bacterium]
MKLLADENVPGALVAALRNAGHDIVWARVETPGVADPAILDRARREERTLVTFDKDFGELAFRSRLPAACGIILVRLTIRSAGAVARIVTSALAMRTDWVGHFSVVEEDRVRMTPLPGPEDRPIRSP